MSYPQTPHLFSQAVDLPPFCQPENEFLYAFSRTFNKCVPTNLAFISSVLGTLSIISWLFAQLPQIYKNYKLKSTSGLSIIFLAEWLLGDATNLIGSLFTGQALWQVIIASYYCFVDCCLVGQWIWYEHLQHGRPLRRVWGRWKDNDDDAGSDTDALSIASTMNVPAQSNSRASSPRPIEHVRPHTAESMFHTPKFSRSPSVMDVSSSQNTPTSNRHITRLAGSTSPMPSPRTVLYISLLLAVVARASPIEHVVANAASESGLSFMEKFGKFCSWLSTFLYLGSRLPQLYKNHVRRSTAGLSLTLFAAAFFGNLFYSSSMLANPCFWYTFPPSRGDFDNPSRGWVGPEGTDRKNWTLRAMPFFFGAAGVLFMDAAVAVQFWRFGQGSTKAREEVLVVVMPDPKNNRSTSRDHQRALRWRWRRVSGFMRGWVPAVGAVGTLARKSDPETQDEGRGLLEASASVESYGGTSHG